MKTLINWLKGNLTTQCEICDNAMNKLENLPDGLHSFILTIDKQAEFGTEYHLGIFDK